MSEVRGRCLDSETGSTISDSRVELTGISATGFTRRSATDEKGSFSFDGIPPGSYEITVYSLYHFPASVVVSVGETALSEVVLYTTKSILGCFPASTSRLISTKTESVGVEMIANVPFVNLKIGDF